MSDVTAVPLRPIAKNAISSLWIGLALLVLFAVALAYWGTQSQVAMGQPASEFLAQNGKRSGVKTTPSGLQYEVLQEGAGPKIGPSDMVRVNYDGRLANGVSFDASANHGGPATLPVGGLIPGWTEGLQLMNKGAKYRFWIPPELAYGPAGAGGGAIPPNALLIFDVEVVDVAPQAAAAMGGGGMPPGMEGMGSPHGEVAGPQ